MAAANGATAAQFDADMTAFGVYPNQAGQAWPELVDQLLAIYRDKVSVLPWVPTDWLPGVEEIAARTAAPVIVSAHLPSGALRDTLPDWIKADPDIANAWDHLAAQASDAVSKYAAGQVAAGRLVLDQVYADAAFWNGLYSFTKAIADAPANVASSVLGGVQYVAGGTLKALFSSWLVWLGVAGAAGFAAWKLGLLKIKRGKSRG